MAKGQFGKANPFYGKHHSKESIDKIRAARKHQIMGKGKNANNWKRGSFSELGYIKVYCPNHPYNKKGYIREHRFVVENFLNRYLTHIEECHHINGIRNDNRIENLMVFISKASHRRWHNNPKYVKPNEIVFDGRKIKHPAPSICNLCL